MDQKKIESDELKQLWEITKEINENIRHYNEHQTKYRTLASQWLLAAMAGIGFLFDAKTGLPFSNLLLILLICLISALGILQLWRMDLVVFQRIIGSFFSEGLNIEKANPLLPAIKTKILNCVPHKNAGQNLFYFYCFIISMFLLIATICFCYLPTAEQIFYFLPDGVIKIASFSVLALTLLVLYRYMRFMSNAENDMSKIEEEKNKRSGWWNKRKPYWW